MFAITLLAIDVLPKLALAEVILPDAVRVTVDITLAPVISPLGPAVDILPNIALPSSVNRLVV